MTTTLAILAALTLAILVERRRGYLLRLVDSLIATLDRSCDADRRRRE